MVERMHGESGAGTLDALDSDGIRNRIRWSAGGCSIPVSKVLTAVNDSKENAPDPLSAA